jgi:cob(I)alamin adenosyltransferase
VKIYTRGGDAGETSLFGGERVRKDHLRVEAYGGVDETNAAIGLALVDLGDADVRECLSEVQRRLFDVGGELATPDVEDRERRGKGIPRVGDADVLALEQAIDRFESELAPLKNFVLPGGARAAAALHLARTTCRRAERRVVGLSEHAPVAPVLVRYLNRLSDLLFVLARVANRRAGVAEPTWSGGKR